MYVLRDYQEKAVEDTRTAFAKGYNAPCLVLSTGAGKCFAKGTPIMLFDGSVKSVENIRVGDLLMGYDSKPRTVKSICTGIEQMYDIVPVKGEKYTVNESHILSLKITGKNTCVSCGGKTYRGGDVVNITVKDYLSATKNFKRVAKGWRTGVSFPEKQLPLPPYLLGVWLGDGNCRNQGITNCDKEIIKEIYDYAKSVGNYVRVSDDITYYIHRGASPKVKNVFLDGLKSLNLLQNKHIPKIYLQNSRKNRLELLAGLIDSDGYVSHNGCDYITKSKQLAEDITYLCRSLGLAAYVHVAKKSWTHNKIKKTDNYYRLFISGDLSVIPCKVARKKASKRKQKKNVLVTGISVIPVGVGQYFGFELEEENRMFLLGDFTVAHNTVCAGQIIHDAFHKGKRVIFVVHRQELAKQTDKTLKGYGVTASFIMAGKPADYDNPIQIATIGTLCNRLDKVKTPDLIILDECNHCMANQWLKLKQHFRKSKMIGLTATPCRLDGKPLREYFDTLVIGPSTADLITKGALTPYDYYAPSRIDTSGMKHNKTDFTADALSFFSQKREIIGDNIQQYQRLANGKRNIVFACNVKHSLEIVKRYQDAGIPAAHLDGETPQADREKILSQFASGEIKVLSNVELFGEGFDLPAIEVVSLLRPTLSTSLYLQQVGRALRPCPELGKERALILDHVGNYERHGMPDDYREWSLKGGLVKKTSAKPTEATVRVQRCPECFFAHSPAHTCPMCGHVYKNECGVKEVAGELVLLGTQEHRDALKKEIKNVESYEELVKIENERGYKMWWAENTWLRMSGEDLRLSITGLTRVAKARGYSRGWAWLQAKRRGRI